MTTGFRLSSDRIAEILVEARSYQDEEAANRAGICVRSLRDYRARLRNDPELATLFHQERVGE